MLESLLFTIRPPTGTAGPYRYYRMYITARNLPAAITVCEWEIIDEGGVNRALNKTATASSQDQGLAGHAVDGVVPSDLSGSRWQTNTTGVHWLQVDIGESIIAKEFNLYVDSSKITNYADYSPNTWEFQGSNDTSEWVKLAAVANYTSSAWKSKYKHTWPVAPA